jgi:hypothetical protein
MKKNDLHGGCKQIFIGYFLLFWTLSSIHCIAQTTTPAACNSPAALITVGTPLTNYNISDTTINDPNVTGCGGAASRDGWFTFQATASTHSVICEVNNRAAVLYAYSGTCGVGLTPIGCSNWFFTLNGGQTETLNLAGLTIGAFYYIRVVNTSANIMLINSIYVTTPPANDQCGAATATSVNIGTTCTLTASGTTIGASQFQASCIGGEDSGDDDVWFTFNATSSSHTITVTPGTMSNVVLQTFSGSCSALASLGCTNATTGAGAETVTLGSLTPGNPYFVKIHSFNALSTSRGTFTVCVSTPPVPPTNNDCTGATTLTPAAGLTCGTPTSGTSIGATQSITAISCGGFTGNANDDVWYKFTATGTTHIVTVAGATGFDPVVDIRSGACNGTNLNCADSTAAAGIETFNLSGLTAGTVYFIRIYGYGGAGTEGNFTVCVTTPVPPANDNCSAPIPLTPASSCSATAGTTVGATQTLAAITCNAGTGNANDDVWYSFVASAATQTVSVAGIGTFNAVVDVRSGACNGTNIGCADATTTGTETVNLTGLTTGATYYVRIYSYGGSGSEGSFTICITIPPSNNDCSGAVALTVNPTTACTATTSGTTANATQSQAGCSGNADDDVWYSFLATASSHYVSVTPGTLTDAVFQVFSGACGGLASVSCVDGTSGTAAESTTLSGLTVGNTYYVRVYSYGNAANQGTFTVCVSTIVAPANDICTGAVDLTVNPTTACTVSTSGTTQGTSQSLAGCSGTADDDVWYTFTATGTSHIITVNPGSIGDLVFQVFSGNCGALTSIGCIDSVFSTGTESATATGLTIGTTYYIRVYSYASGTASQGSFDICITTLTVPANDGCTGAVSLTTATSCSPTSGTTLGAGQSLAGCSGNADDDVWYSFTATSTAHTVTVNPGTLYDAVFQVFGGTCSGLTSLGCTDLTTGANIETATLSGLTTGVVYYVRVYSYAGNGDQGTFTICVTTPVPSSDNCATSSALFVNLTPSCVSNTTGTTIGATLSQTGCAGNADDDVWYNFTATGTSHIVTVTPGTLNNAVFEVFGGSCGSLVSRACINATTAANIETTTLTSLTIGAVYYVRIYSNGAAANQGTFTICITTPCTTGTGTGTTTLGCPSVTSGGLGLNGADPAAVNCLSSGCVNLEATYLQLGQTTSYTVESISYAPPYQFGCLANPVSVNVDDVWSPIVNLPFNFCFYGNLYNQCLIGSNGLITFDLANNSPGGYSDWEILNNIPSANLTLNSIFGVYHDIDPSVSGKVGWELITLNTGCRALVAAWQNIPMYDDIFTTFDCNGQLYTGMIVLYENTNIIDVYVQEKNVCSDWNDGNAIVGIQNASGTIATTAPNRNGLDTNWNVTSEAWRFVPSGPSITSLKWYQGAGTSGPVVGTTDVINVCPTVTTTYTAEVTYTLCNGTPFREIEQTVVTVDGNKVWNGSMGSNWNVAANWTPSGIPTASDCVVIPDVTPGATDPIISGPNYDAYGYSLRVLPGGNLILNSDNNLTIINVLNVNPGGTFNIKNNGSLIQVDNVANTGTINMERITTPVYRFDYTYWGSPMTQASNYTLGALSQNLTQPDKYYSWIPSVSNGIGGWKQESIATVMDPRKGYIVRAPNTFSFTPTVFTPYIANFVGTPNNGDITCPITFGADPGINDQWNLLANPYPSAVKGSLFLAAPNSNVINGTIYFWTHHNAISSGFPDPFYGDFVLNYTSSDYAIWNGGTGGVAAWLGGPIPNGHIAAGQSFFVQSKSVAGNAVFSNAMRESNFNSQFWRTAAPMTTPDSDEETLERHRIWLNMTNSTNAFNQLLVGYIENATIDWEQNFDGIHMNQGALNFYSVIPENKLVIQGRALPFNVNDQVPLGYNTTMSGNFSIRIDHFDGLLADQNIYIEDKLLQVIHNLKQSPYHFLTQAGVFDNRFILRYTDNALGIEIPDALSGLNAFIKNETLFVKASENIESIQVYDIAGKLIRIFAPAETASEFHGDFHYAQGVYLAKIRLADSTTGSRKLMN